MRAKGQRIKEAALVKLPTLEVISDSGPVRYMNRWMRMELGFSTKTFGKSRVKLVAKRAYWITEVKP